MAVSHFCRYHGNIFTKLTDFIQMSGWDLIEDTQTLVIAQYEGKELHLFDVISKEQVELTALLAAVVSTEISSVHFHFTPQFSDIRVVATPSLIESDTTLFIRSNSARLSLPNFLRFPLVAQA
ncbi:hypothetical protein [Paenibacillus sp. FSL H8-0034]|uniref:hypothetical protein n=1 Tax=Paenibacillus sp. FSL H8-0034 TaxID=2954671 RepID=UPI0030FD0B37